MVLSELRPRHLYAGYESAHVDRVRLAPLAPWVEPYSAQPVKADDHQSLPPLDELPLSNEDDESDDDDDESDENEPQSELPDEDEDELEGSGLGEGEPQSLEPDEW